MLSLIVALAENNAIGINGRMPWHLPGDLKRVKALTMGKTLIMGRRTLESLPGLLPGRKHLVITTDKKFSQEGVTAVHSLEEAAKEFLAPGSPEAFIFGGAAVYKAALPLCKRLYLTKIRAEFDADTYFPQFNAREFTVMEESEIFTDEASGLKYNFLTLERG